ncbi:DUF6479 family protein [Streptomyces sp. CA-278952]|uniref:DUF6479 family protein n=1 Tax=unclassified Streptomyces TaxID=2593676 RepID=UPI002368B4CC|nr:DUF6479 family protein [Streptomyces sp. CA-278952]WDG27316.1 DUF6479 family protein [Streptomyces sp. CA-278952]
MRATQGLVQHQAPAATSAGCDSEPELASWQHGRPVRASSRPCRVTAHDFHRAEREPALERDTHDNDTERKQVLAMTTLLERTSTEGRHLAAEEWAGGTVPFIVGLFVVALLIGTVVWRTRKGRSRPPRPEEQRHRSTAAFNAPDEPRAADDFGGEGERLSPHQMKGYGNLGGPARSEDDRSGGHGSGGHGA